MVWHSVQSMMALLAIMAVGFFINGAGWFRQHGTDILSKYASRIAIPCYIFINMYELVDNRAALFKLFSYTPVPMINIGINFALAFLLAKFLKVTPVRAGVFVNGIALNNTVIIGFPVVQMLLGNAALSDGMVYYVANTLWFWIVGVALLRWCAGDKSRMFSKQGLKNLFSPVFITLILALILKALEIQLPFIIFYPIDSIGKTCAGISLIFIGCVIRQTDFKRISLSRDLIGLMVGRLILVPLVALLVGVVMPASLQMRQIVLILSMMPAMSQLGIMAKETGSDYEYASIVVSLTTLISIICIPFYMWMGQIAGLFPGT